MPVFSDEFMTFIRYAATTISAAATKDDLEHLKREVIVKEDLDAFRKEFKAEIAIMLAPLAARVKKITEGAECIVKAIGELAVEKDLRKQSVEGVRVFAADLRDDVSALATHLQNVCAGIDSQADREGHLSEVAQAEERASEAPLGSGTICVETPDMSPTVNVAVERDDKWVSKTRPGKHSHRRRRSPRVKPRCGEEPLPPVSTSTSASPTMDDAVPSTTTTTSSATTTPPRHPVIHIPNNFVREAEATDCSERESDYDKENSGSLPSFENVKVRDRRKRKAFFDDRDRSTPRIMKSSSQRAAPNTPSRQQGSSKRARLE
ncbi:hypothetical protein HK102_011853 [Quaeritorhiza haematococci]|nr:hypothetical protein HK102_011853 [Quaeritorhiza haematococci]